MDTLIVRPIVNILLVIYNFVGDFGLSVIIFTILIKLLFWPLMKKQLDQTRLMREIQPEIAKIQKNCKGNKQMESLQMMELYKRKDIKPFRSMLMMFIQLPIFIGLFTAVNVMVMPRVNPEKPHKDYTVEHSAYYYLEDLPRIHELIEHQNKYLTEVAQYKEEHKGDQEALRNMDIEYGFKPQLLGRIDLSQHAGFDSPSKVFILVLVLASAGAQVIMSRQMDPSRQSGKKRKTMRQLFKEAAEGKEPSQEDLNAITQSQMTFMMPFMMLMIMIGLPGAVVLYYFLNNILTIIQQKFVFSQAYTDMVTEKEKSEKEKSALEAEIISDTPKTKKPAAKKAQSKPLYGDEHKNKNEHITRISASNKKKRR